MKREQLYLSTIGEDAVPAAREFGLGLELAQFCQAAYLDQRRGEVEDDVARCLAASPRRTLHAPFNELTPAAIDPLVLEVAEKRYRQTLALAETLGVRRIVVHAGYVPLVYHPSWFRDRSVEFWSALVKQVPDGTVLCLENVMEPDAGFLTGIAEAVASPKLRLCLDAGHANTCVSREPPLRWLERAAPYLAHVHLHNNDGNMDLHQPLARGTIDMEAFVRALSRLAPAATCTLELARCRESVLWLLERGLLE